MLTRPNGEAAVTLQDHVAWAIQVCARVDAEVAVPLRCLRSVDGDAQAGRDDEPLSQTH